MTDPLSHIHYIEFCLVVIFSCYGLSWYVEGRDMIRLAEFLKMLCASYAGAAIFFTIMLFVSHG